LQRDRPVRVLHVLSSLVHAGIETWLMHMFRRMDPARVQHEVILLKPEPGAHEPEAERLGVKLHRAQRRGRVDLLRRLDALLASGQYDVVHSHMYMFSGLVMGVAARHKVPIRIAHCHHAAMTQDGGGLAARLEHAALKALIGRWATLKLGISESAIEEIAGADWRSQADSKILLYGFDFSRYSSASERAADVREVLGLAPDTEVIGHVGRFVVEKNHPFLFRTFAQLVKRRPAARLVMVGAGPLQSEAEALVEDLGIRDSVIFAGTTSDVPAYMSMFDLFLLTSTSEGLGIVVLEAQAAGTPCLISDVVPREVDIIPELLDRARLAEPAEQWAEIMARRLGSRSPKDDGAWRKLEASTFGIDRCVAELESYYERRHG